MDIKGTMRKYGYTMQQLAEKIDSSQSSLSQVMNNPSPTLKMLDKIAEGLGCKRWEFFLDEMDPEEVRAKISGVGVVRQAAPAVREQSDANELPFNESEAEQVQAVRFSYQCPRCGERMNVCISPGKKK